MKGGAISGMTDRASTSERQAMLTPRDDREGHRHAERCRQRVAPPLVRMELYSARL